MKKLQKKTTSKIKKAISILIVAAATAYAMSAPSEYSLRNRVVKLVGNGAACSGEQIRTASGKDYILTAGHCKLLSVDGSIDAIKEDGSTFSAHVIAEDPNSDLLLLEGLPNVKGIAIATSYSKGQEVRTFTHPRGVATVKSEGELIEVDEIPIPMPPEACASGLAKYKMLNISLSLGEISIDLQQCVMSVKEIASSAAIQAGSSGGMVVDTAGKLVAVVSAGGQGFSWFVTLTDIQSFLRAY